MNTNNSIYQIQTNKYKTEGRLDFIDLAKGIGMFMVIYLHITINYNSTENLYQGSQWDTFVHSMFMPLFFIISGLFFSVKLPFKEWVRKKIHRMVFPFILFYILTYVINVILVTFLKVELKSGFSYSDIFIVFYKDVYPNSAIWFLLALFWSSIILYWILKATDKSLIQCFLVIASFFIGYILDKTHTNIPLYVDTAFSAVPFLYTGFIMKKYNVFELLKNTQLSTRLFIVILVGITCFLFDWFYGHGGSMVNNQGVSIIVYLSGLTGSMACICFAFIIRKLPLVSYIGRYSMLVLCSHMFLTNAFTKVLQKFDITFLYSSVLALLLVTISYYVIVPVVKLCKPLKCLL